MRPDVNDQWYTAVRTLLLDGNAFTCPCGSAGFQRNVLRPSLFRCVQCAATAARGEWGGQCIMPSCSARDATWEFVRTGKHYCHTCAEAINHAYKDSCQQVLQ